MMKQKPLFLNTALAVLVAVHLLGAILTRAYFPGVLLPGWDITDLTGVSLAALLAERFMAPGAKRCYGAVFLCSALVFGLLPWAAGFTAAAEVWYCGLAGGSVFTAAAWLFSSMMERLDSGRSSRFTPLICALGLYLAVQAFSGMG